MKQILLTLSLFLSGLTLLHGQCTRENSLSAVDDPEQYPVTGTATMLFETSGTKQVIFQDDFATVQGIELRVFLSTTERLNQGGTAIEITTEPLQDDNGGMDTGDAITGMKIFELPDTVALEDFDYVIIQCVQADVLWGRALLGDLEGADCASLSTPENPLNLVRVVPNPAQDVFSIQGLNNPAKIAIFDMLGKQVLQTTHTRNEPLSIVAFPAGMYVIQITSQGQQITQKLIIQ